jgi:hypothetical protein
MRAFLEYAPMRPFDVRSVHLCRKEDLAYHLAVAGNLHEHVPGRRGVALRDQPESCVPARALDRAVDGDPFEIVEDLRAVSRHR